MQRITNARQRGFTLIELMIATTVATFLLGGVFYSLQSTRNAYTQQTGLAQLQDNVRLSMALITDVVESAGYFPQPLTNTAVAQFPVGAPFTTAGQAIFGTGNAAAPGDTITVRYASGAVNDNAMNCLGQTNTTGAVQLMTNKFSVVGNQLVCTYNGTIYPLITSGVLNMQLVYGVKRVGGTATCTDTYLKSTEMTAADWNVICSVRVSLTFDNPVKRTGVGPQTITITRVIGVMSTAGVNT